MRSRGIAAESVGSIDGLCHGCSPGLLRMYGACTDGRRVLREIDMKFCRNDVSGATRPEKSGCWYAE